MVIRHKIKHYYQPTNFSCCQSATAMLLSFFDVYISPEDIMNSVPTTKNEEGEDWGTITQDIAKWCITRGYEVTIYTADFQIIDLSWAGLSNDELLKRMKLAKTKHNPPSHTSYSAQMYMQSYINFIEEGGQLRIIPYMSSKLLDSLLQQGPVLVNVSFAVLYNIGRFSNAGLRQMKLDDIDGKIFNHSIVVYGKNTDDNYLIADPWQTPGFHTVEAERLLAAMTASQVEWDNLIIQLKKTST